MLRWLNRCPTYGEPFGAITIRMKPNLVNQHAVSHSELPLGLTKLHVFVNLFLFKNLKFKIFKNTFLSSEFFLFQKEYAQKFQKCFSFICPFPKKKNQKSRIQKLFILFFKVLFFQKKKKYIQKALKKKKIAHQGL